jgi:hypothetical protein
VRAFSAETRTANAYLEKINMTYKMGQVNSRIGLTINVKYKMRDLAKAPLNLCPLERSQSGPLESDLRFLVTINQ